MGMSTREIADMMTAVGYQRGVNSVLGKRGRAGDRSLVRYNYYGNKRRKMIAPGFTRASGYYGRYGTRAARKRAQRLCMPVEEKFFDTTLSFSFDATAEVPATGQLALIPQGDTESTRDGRQCTITSIYIKGMAQFVPAAAATASSIAYLYLVLDTQCNGAAAGATDVLTGTGMITAHMNLANSGRFKILKKWVIAQNATAGVTTAYNNYVTYIEGYKKCKIPMEYSGTTGAISEIKSNNIFLLSGSSITDDTVNFSGSCRLRFVG